MRLDAVEGRVLGSLVEKQLTTPQQYPLTLNSLTLACNQSTSREPVTAYEEAEVRAALDALKQRGLVRFVLPSHGRSVVRYRQVLDERLALDVRQSALVGVLLLRGSQTAAELRARTERMAKFDSLGEVESDLAGLAGWDDPLVRRLGRRPGQKEERWAQLLAAEELGAAAESEPEAALWPRGDQAPPALATPSSGADYAADEVARLRGEMATMRGDLDELRREVQALRRELGD